MSDWWKNPVLQGEDNDYGQYDYLIEKLQKTMQNGNILDGNDAAVVVGRKDIWYFIPYIISIVWMDGIAWTILIVGSVDLKVNYTVLSARLSLKLKYLSLHLSYTKTERKTLSIITILLKRL